MPSKIQPKSLIKKNTKDTKDKKPKQQGGLESKDDPDKKDKNNYDPSENEEVDEEENEEDLENLEESEEESDESEGEEIDKEKEKEEEEGGEGYEEGGDDDVCVYKFTKKKQVIDLDLEAGEDQFEDEQEVLSQNIYVPNNERITKKILFNYERVRILGERARQLSLGAKPMLKNVENLDPKTVAKLELEHKVIPLIVLRELPSGRIEKWKVSELKF